MKLRIFSFILLFFITSTGNMLNGQIMPDTVYDTDIEIALSNASQLYSKTLGKNNHLNNGREYNYRYIGVEGNPFFGGNEWNKGSVYYDNHLYEDINMKFDVHNNVLIIVYYDNKGFFVNLQLVTDKIERFSWPGHFFINIEADTLKNPGLSAGFYDLLYDGKIDVLANYTKTIQKNYNSTQYFQIFSKKEFFYIRNSDNVFKVARKRSILKALPNKERELKAYIKKHKLKFKDENLRGIQIAGVAAYYDSINE